MDQSSRSFSNLELVLVVLGEADDALRGRVEIARASDATVAVQYLKIQSMIQSLRSGVFEAVPATLKKSAIEMFESSRPVTVSEWIAGLARTALTKIFDSRDTPQLAGFRGKSEGCHMTFAEGETEIDILVERDGEHQLVRGQTCGFQAQSVAAIGNDGSIVTTCSVDESGGFTLQVDSAVRELCVRGDTRVVSVEGVFSE